MYGYIIIPFRAVAGRAPNMAAVFAGRPPAPPKQPTQVKQQAQQHQQQQQQQQQHSAVAAEASPAATAMTLPIEAKSPGTPQAAQRAAQQAGPQAPASGSAPAAVKAAPRRIHPSPLPMARHTTASLPVLAAAPLAAASLPAATPSPVPAATPAGDTDAAAVVPGSTLATAAAMPKGASAPKRQIEPNDVSVGAVLTSEPVATGQTTSAPASQPAVPVDHTSGAAKPTPGQKRRIAPQPVPPQQPTAAATAICSPVPGATVPERRILSPEKRPVIFSERSNRAPSSVTAAAAAKTVAGGPAGKRSGVGVSGLAAGTAPKKQRRLTPMPVT